MGRKAACKPVRDQALAVRQSRYRLRHQAPAPDQPSPEPEQRVSAPAPILVVEDVEKEGSPEPLLGLADVGSDAGSDPRLAEPVFEHLADLFADVELDGPAARSPSADPPPPPPSPSNASVPASPAVDDETTDLLRRAWSPQCDCENVPEPLTGTRLGLNGMSRYWSDHWPWSADVRENIRLPVHLGSCLPRDGRWGDYRHVEWRRLLSDDPRSCPSLDLRLSDRDSPELRIHRRWDVDSVIALATSLGVHCFGFDLSYSPPFARRITQNPYVRFEGKVLHQIKNQRLGKGVIGGPYECHACFPQLPVPEGGETHLTKQQQRVWIDRIILPALRASCPDDILQHHPRSFAEVQAKAHAREEIHVSGSGQAMEVQHVIPDRYLDAFWTEVLRLSREPGLEVFRGVFLIVSGHNLKLWTKSDGPGQARDRFLDHFQRCFRNEPRYLPPDDCWIDLGIEDTPSTPDGQAITLLRKTGCNEHWTSRFRSSAGGSPLTRSHRFPEALMRDAGASTVQLFRPNPWYRGGGLAYHKAYNLQKNVLATPAKGLKPFDLPQLEGLAYDQPLLNRWYELNHRGGQTRYPEKRRQLLTAYQKIKGRLDTAYRDANRCNFGVRQEYRMTLDRARRLDDEAGDSIIAGHRPYHVLHTRELHEYLATNVGRWLLLLEALMSQTHQGPVGFPPVSAEQQMIHGIMVSAVVRILRSKLGGGEYLLRRSLWSSSWQPRQRSRRDRDDGPPVKLGLKLRDCLQAHGYACLMTDQVQWTGLPTFRPGIIHRLGLAKNGFGRQLRHSVEVQHLLTAENRFFGLFQRWLDRSMLLPEDSSAEHGRDQVMQAAAQLVIQSYIQEILDLLQRRIPTLDGEPAVRIRDRLGSDEAEGLEGLTYVMAEKLLRRPPHVILVKKSARHGRSLLGQYNTGHWYDKVAGVFRWDDRDDDLLKIRGWEDSPFRILARRLGRMIEVTCGPEASERFRRQVLVDTACEKLWILPQYDIDKLSVMRKGSKHNATETVDALKELSDVDRTNWIMPQLRSSLFPLLEALERAWDRDRKPRMQDLDRWQEIVDELERPSCLSVLSEGRHHGRYQGLVKNPHRYGQEARLFQAAMFWAELRGAAG